MPLTTGTCLGPYEIQSQLGAGGMGEVYRANDTRLDRTVAIKVLPAHVADDPDIRQSFCRLVTMPMDYLLAVDASGLNGYPGAPFSMSGASVVILSLSGKSTPKALVSFADP